MHLQTVEIGQIPPEMGFLPGNTKACERTKPSCSPREGNSRPDPRQLALFCPCGALPPLTAGLCNSCYWKWRHSLRFFGGRREEVLKRDSRRCRACGSDHWIGVHHRQPGSNAPSLLLCLCAACHAQVHRLLSIWKWIPGLVAELWAEQHPGAPVQLQIELSVQIELNFRGREVKSVPQGAGLG
jgi:NMD protein affecting ribosome stability and mRNA decay